MDLLDLLENVQEPCQNSAGGDELENRVEKLRKERGLNQEEFARAIRVSRQTVSSIETGKYNPSLDLAFTIADFFGMTIEEIFIHKGGADNEKELMYFQISAFSLFLICTARAMIFSFQLSSWALS